MLKLIVPEKRCHESNLCMHILKINALIGHKTQAIGILNIKPVTPTEKMFSGRMNWVDFVMLCSRCAEIIHRRCFLLGGSTIVPLVVCIIWDVVHLLISACWG